MPDIVAEPSKLDQAMQLLAAAKALDALGRSSRTVGAFTVETKPKPRLLVGRSRMNVSEAVAARFGQAIGEAFQSLIADMQQQARTLLADVATPATAIPAAAPPASTEVSK